MSLNDLVTSQPEQEVTTPSEPENAMVNEQGEQASATPVNVDGEQSSESTQEQEQTRTEKRINQLIGQNREMQEKLIASDAAREAIERNMDHFQSSDVSTERKLSDLDSTQLKEFISTARDSDDLEVYIPEAEALLLNRTVEEKIDIYKQEQSSQKRENEGLELTNLLLNNLGGERLRNTESKYFQDVQSTLQDLSSDQFKHVNKDQLLATALAEVNHLKSQLSGPSLTDRVVDNRVNSQKIIANSGGSTSGSTDMASFLATTGGKLTRSKQGEKGTLSQAIGSLNLMKEFTGG